MSQHEFLSRIVQSLEAAGIPYMVAGSHASSYHGNPRATNDVDLVIDPTAAQLDSFLAGLGGQYYVSPQAARDAFRGRSIFNVIDLSAGLKADLILRKDRPFSIEEFQRRQLESLYGRSMPIASPEDVILSKLEWDRTTSSERQVQDALNVAVARGPRLDRPYLRKWAAPLGVVEKLEEVLRKADESPLAPRT